MRKLILAGGKSHKVSLKGALERVGATRTKLRSAVRRWLIELRIEEEYPPLTMRSFLEVCPNVTQYEIQSLYCTWRCFKDQEVRPELMRQANQRRKQLCREWQEAFDARHA